MKNICIFCGSSKGNDPIYLEKANSLAEKLAKENFNLVYGGGTMGLMGSIAKTFKENKSDVYGFIPESMLSYIDSGDTLCSKVTVCSDMHSRKKQMYDNSDCFICVSGGIGTLDEFFEILTWRQLEYHNKAIALFNVNKFFDPVVLMIKNQIKNGFVKQEILDLLIIEEDEKKLIQKIKEYKKSKLKHKWNENDKV